MKSLTRNFALLSLAASLITGITTASAQDQTQPANPGGPGGQGGPGGGRNFDPAQMRQRMMERMKEQFGVTNDDEWKIISERIEKVTEARRGTGGGMGAMMGFGGGRGPGGPGGNRPDGAQGGGGGGGRGRGGVSSPESDDLQKSIDANASPEELKAKMAKLREARKVKEEELKVAQTELKEVLNTKQEAVAMVMGLLP